MAELRGATRALSARGLKLAAKWAAEMAVGLPAGAAAAAEAPAEPEPLGCDPPRPAADDAESDALALAKCVFDLGEYGRCAGLLTRAAAADADACPRARFLRWYALFLDGERAREEEAVESGDVLDRSRATNEALRGLHGELAPLHASGELDGFGLYLFGVVLRGLGHERESVVGPVNAVSVLLQSVGRYPWNWSAWLDLAALVVDDEAFELPAQHPALRRAPYMADLFSAHLLLERQQGDPALAALERLQATFPGARYLRAQMALAQYAQRNFDEAEARFEALRAADPEALDHMDVYSNILYVKEAKRELSHLAHAAVRVDKYRPQTCAIVGNYYSLKGQHERAVQFFQRALKIDRQYLSAWTLMGHEFVELRSVSAAIEAYRRAVDINPRDYRAWYGLGQTYELLQMPLYALHYYQRATALRPYDARMWIATAGCLEKLGGKHTRDAVRAYERAAANDDREGIATVKLAALHLELGDDDRAALYYERVAEGPDSDDVVDALRFLTHYYRQGHQLDQAAAAAARLLNFPGPEADEAAAVLREIRSAEALGASSVGSIQTSPGSAFVSRG